MRFLYLILLCIFTVSAGAEILDIDIAVNNARVSCAGISDKLAPLKKMAGINVGITGVGTAVNAGATVVGIVKAKKDKQAEELEKMLAELERLNEKSEKDYPTQDETNALLEDFKQQLTVATKNKSGYQSELDKLTKQSKNLGDWRTGLMAGGTVTNVAGAVIAGKNQTDDDLESMINSCSKSIKDLRDSMMQARVSGQNIGNAEKIVSACGEYDFVDLSKINNRAKGAMISSIVGATTGAVGTVTSAVANTDATRNDNTDSGKQKEKNLNTASNVLAGASTVASTTAVVFNATQISAIKKVSTVADNCEMELAK